MKVQNSKENKLKGNKIASEPEGSLRDILNILFRHKILIVSTFVVISFIAIIVTILTPKIYQSDAQVLLRVGRENVSLDPTIEGPNIGLFQEKDKETKSEVAILYSRVLAEKVVDKLGTDFILECPASVSGGNREPAGNEGTKDVSDKGIKSRRYIMATNAIKGGLSVVQQKETNIIDLSFTSRDPQCAQLFLDEIISAYLDRHIEINRILAKPSFFQEQADELFNQLTNKEKELKEFRSRYDIVSIKDQKISLLHQIETLQSDLDNKISGALASGVKISSFEKNLSSKSPSVELYRTSGHENFTSKDLKTKLAELRLEESDLSSRFQDDYRPLVTLREKIKYMESLLSQEYDTNTEVTSGLSETYQSLEINLDLEKANFKYLLAQQEAVSNLLAQRKKELSALSDKESYLTSLERDISMLEKEYVAYRDNLQRAKISNALDIEKVSNVKIVQPATLSTKHIKPKREVNISIGLALGLFGGIALAFIVEFFDDTMKTNEDVEKRLGVPVLAYVSKEEFESCA